jgi:5-methylcytosine-specific restriction endonuclease McrA
MAGLLSHASAYLFDNLEGVTLAEQWKAYKEARSPEWPAFRRLILKKNPACEACGTKHDLEIHHVKDFCHHPELELVESNCMTLCMTPWEEDHLMIGHTVFGKSDWSLTNPHARMDAEIKRMRRK